ncbi:MAG: cyclopropane-fatty-acyl-phospholipid synthase family protein [Capsulimonadales bacterium]|nr:cyclopropane-fatty-acyl-phospholipid synthase family protein [Capsulimonadales bacterium]
MPDTQDARRLAAARKILEYVAEAVQARFSVRLWDGSLVPLGPEVEPGYFLSIRGPGVLGSLLRRPNIETLLRHYASGDLDFHGGDLMAFGDIARSRRSKTRLRGVSYGVLLRDALVLLLTPPDKPDLKHGYADDETGLNPSRRNNREFIQFHYDVSNEFYALFLDPEMQYSCAYFTDWNNTLAQAQTDKIEMICRKLRLQADERMLDIGCGWGGLICYAARKYGVIAHGVTLSERQHEFVQAKIRNLGLEGRVTVELCDYMDVTGVYDKVASVGMFEHVGIDNLPGYCRKVASLLRDRGIFLNHGITRRAKASSKDFRKITPEKRLILKYIFPGSELDHVGHVQECMEAGGFEIQDVEGWRWHYGLTSRYWCQRLSARREEAVALVGEERYRMWVAYLAAVSFNFADGPLRLYQILATKHGSKGPSGLPPTRRDLYEDRA